MSLLNSPVQYKPFNYPWAYEAWLQQQRTHWLPEEVPLGEDVKDWATGLTPEEKNLLTHIFRFFTQSDIEVNNCYMRNYMPIFKPTEVLMMMSAFSNMETIHVAAYSHLLDTVGMPESTYEAFLNYQEMRDKHDFMQEFSCDTKEGIATTMAIFGAFIEGLQLFASFAILLNFPRHNKMKGMGQIVTWSVRDETLHMNSMIKMYHTFLQENPDIVNNKLKEDLVRYGRRAVECEDKFIDLAFEMGGIEGLTAEEVKQYIRYIGDRRFQQLGLPIQYGVAENPLPWLDVMLNADEHANFFEQRSTEYSKSAQTGSWEDAF
jgi:ribonucleoside-diphosphate reductase beta chain